MLALRALTKRFGSTVAVNGLDLTCAEHEFLVLFGPAGAGKSTTLRMVAGVLEPSSGEVSFGGRSLKGVPPERRNMAMVFESYSLYSHLTVAENLAFPLRARRLPEAEIRRRLAEMAGVLQIEPLLDRRPGFLSGGQRQRVALGRALIREADVYLLDEPISHLDAKLRHRMRGELKAMCAKKAATVIHVTHDFREAMALSDRVAVIDRGRIRQIGPPGDVYDLPDDEFVAGFVGDPPMSLVEVSYLERDGARLLEIVGSGATIAAPPDLSAHLERVRPSTLKVGFRAGEVKLSPTPGTGLVEVKVFATETLGVRNVVVAELGPRHVRVFSSPGSAYRSGVPLWLDLHPGNVHLFADGRAVHHPRTLGLAPKPN